MFIYSFIYCYFHSYFCFFIFIHLVLFYLASLKENLKIFSGKKFSSDPAYRESVLEGIRLGREKEVEKEGGKEVEHFSPTYISIIPFIPADNVCVCCSGTRFSGPFLVCGKCTGKYGQTLDRRFHTCNLLFF